MPPHRTGGQGEQTGPSLVDEVSTALRDARSHFDRWRGELTTLGRIQVERTRHAALNGVVALLFGAGALLAAATALVTATILFVRGISGAIADVTETLWLGDLAGGFATLLALALVAGIARWALRRKELARLRTSLDGAAAGSNPEVRS